MRQINLDYVIDAFKYVSMEEGDILQINPGWSILYIKINCLGINSWSFKEGFTREVAIL